MHLHKNAVQNLDVHGVIARRIVVRGEVVHQDQLPHRVCLRELRVGDTLIVRAGLVAIAVLERPDSAAVPVTEPQICTERQ